MSRIEEGHTIPQLADHFILERSNDWSKHIERVRARTLGCHSRLAWAAWLQKESFDVLPKFVQSKIKNLSIAVGYEGLKNPNVILQ